MDYEKQKSSSFSLGTTESMIVTMLRVLDQKKTKKLYQRGTTHCVVGDRIVSTEGRWWTWSLQPIQPPLPHVPKID